ncbi:MAG: hypothetical protein GY832_23895 [Chloroflexi bacterium]|nr:hypothetical protein [Chloroflexota bacterium]
MMSTQLPEHETNPTQGEEENHIIEAKENELALVKVEKDELGLVKVEKDEHGLIVAQGELDLVKVKDDEKKRRSLLILLLGLMSLLCCVGVLFVRYLWRPAALPDLLPLPVDVVTPPHYLFSIYGIDKPVGVAISPQGDRIYVTETSGERQVKIFDRDGDPLDSFVPPRTGPGERSPVYVATDSNGRVFVTDRLQHVVFVYDEDGGYLDTILGPDLTLSEYVFKHINGLQTGDTFAYNAFEPDVYYQKAGESELFLPAPDPVNWAPLGIHIDEANKMLLTDVDGERHTIREIAGSVIMADSWQDFDPSDRSFGTFGQDNGQFLFPNAAVADSQGQIYVSDGNNGRVSAWDSRGNFLFHFGQGSGDGALSLPRGAIVDARDRLYVIDAVGQNVKVYDVSESEPNFLFAFGDWGGGDGQFNYPNDIAFDATTGRLYITDRENNRVQVWLY